MIDLSLWLVAALHIGRAIAAQPEAPKPEAAPLRRLEYGDINFLHTTDIHGWHAGHLLEPSFSADWGDYISFSIRMRERLESRGKDLLIIDTGDRIEGNGLYDGDEPKGNHTFDIFKRQHVDIICSGNHELYKKNSSENEYYLTAPFYHDAYLASNLDIYDEDEDAFVPLAARYKKFTTRLQGIRIMSFGFLFDFTGNYNNTVVTPVETVIKQQWFEAAISDREIDLFVVIGHAGIRSNEFAAVFQAIRHIQPDIPIQFFGGHVHVRDYKKFDSKSYGIASGRYLETIGFQSIRDLPRAGDNSSSVLEPTFFRRYIDNNLFSFYYHSVHKASTFHTKLGRKVTKMITAARSDLKLDATYGCAPQDYWMNRVPYPNASSIFTWLEKEVFPDSVANAERVDKARFVLTNTGAIRFDIFKGAFTRDSTFIVSPFTSDFRYIKDVPYDIAIKVLPVLNGADHIFTALSAEAKLDLRRLAPPEHWNIPVEQDRIVPRAQSMHEYPISSSDPRLKDDSTLDRIASDTQTTITISTQIPSQDTTFLRISGTKECIDQAISTIYGYPVSDNSASNLITTDDTQPPYLIPNDKTQLKNQILLPSSPQEPQAAVPGRNKVTPGYTTTDDAGLDGDDTIHSPIIFYNVPNVFQSYINPHNTSSSSSTPPPATVDLVHNEFLQPYVLLALSHLGYTRSPADVQSYMPGETLTSLMTKWSGVHWKENC